MNKKKLIKTLVATTVFVLLPAVVGVPLLIHYYKKNKRKFIMPDEIKHTNQEAIKMIMGFEGLRLKTYKDLKGVLTIGYGHTGNDVVVDRVITEKQADDLLVNDLKTAENCVKKYIKVPITENMFGALVSFTFNLDCSRLKNSILLKLVNKQDFDNAAKEFGKWVYANNKKVDRLVKRREKEAELFIS